MLDIKDKLRANPIVHAMIRSKPWLLIRQKNYCYRAPYKIRAESRKKLLEYKDKYTGKRCFVIGNGPSLKAADLDLLKGEYCFGANRIYKIYDQTDWRPTFYCVQDLNVLKEMGNEALPTIEQSQNTFIRMMLYSYETDVLKKNSKIIYVPIYTQPLEFGEKIKFTDKAEKFIYDGNTVTYMSLELAAYMGFSEIYLIGVDASFPRIIDRNNNLVKVDLNIVGHFYETVKDNLEGGAEANHAFPLEMWFESYQAAENFSRETGKFRIYNATRGGDLEVYERVKLEEVLF